MSARILVVEDNPEIRGIFESVLGRAGYQTVTAADGIEAIQKLDSESFDLVITDLALPNISGLQVIKKVKQKCCCPVVAMTAYWQTSPLFEEAEALGCDGMLAKPFDNRQLLAVVAQQIHPCVG